MPNSWTFGIFVDGELASSLRVGVATPDNPEKRLPSMSFGDLLRPELGQREDIVDPNRFVADPNNRTKFPELPYMTVRLGYVACGYFKADIGTATVRAEHRAFYRKVFLQTPMCEPRPYPTLTKPLCLMAADYAAVRERIFMRYPISAPVSSSSGLCRAQERASGAGSPFIRVPYRPGRGVAPHLRGKGATVPSSVIADFSAVPAAGFRTKTSCFLRTHRRATFANH